MLEEFKKFALRGNVVDLAVGVIIGAAFGKIVGAFTDGIVNPLLNTIGGDPNISLKLGIFDIGVVISAALSFLITAAVVFFLIVKPMAKLAELGKKPEAPATPPEPPAQEKLLAEIRDLLKTKA